MLFDDDFWRALADCQINFPSLADLGDGNPPSAWLAEYIRVGRTAFASVLLTASGTEGGNASGQRQFSQATIIDALHCRRFDLDPSYTLPVHLTQYPSARVSKARGNRSFQMTFKPAS